VSDPVARITSATTRGTDRAADFFVIVPSSGTGKLAGITGTGGIAIDADGTHRDLARLRAGVTGLRGY
jgi:hypothetical protein